MKTCIPKEIADNFKKAIINGEISNEAILNMLPEDKAALRSVLEDIVSDRLKISIKPEQVTEINKLSKKIDEATQKLGDDLGNPEKIQENVDFFKAKKEMEDYLMQQNPANRLRILTGTIGRGVMLTSLKSPVLNIESNIMIGASEALARRISGGSIQGTDRALASSYIKMARKIYQETGYDIARMQNIYDIGEASGGRVLGDIGHSQGPGAVRKVGRVVEDVVFKQLMGAPDIEFAARHFADSVNLNAYKMMKGDKDAAKVVMEDAMRIEPRTPEGVILREQAIMDAQKATWTDNSWASHVSSGIRKIVNDVSGDLRLGDYFFPFIKTGSNVIATGMDYAGVGAIKALATTVKAIKAGELKNPENIKNIAINLTRSGLGLTGALIVASQLSEDDFVGAYDPKRSQIEALRNSTNNSFRVGNKWFSTDYLGPLAVPFTAIMYARKYGSTKPEKMFQYTKGVGSAVTQIPGISDIYDYVKSNAFEQNQTLEEMTGATQDYITNQLYSRLVPSIVSDISKVVDGKARQGGKGFESVISRTPFLSKTLPEKTTIFGDTIKNEGAVSTLLAGSRVKTSSNDPVVKELSRLSDSTGKGIAFTDFNKSSSKTLAQFKENVGAAKYAIASIEYKRELKAQLTKTMNNPQYQNMSDEARLTLITGKDSEVMETIFRRYGFRYKKEKTERIPNI